jgi:hypothetical protein
MVIAADNDRAMEGQEVGRNPGLIKGQQAASANGAVLMAPSFSEEELEAGFSDWNDLASHDEVRKGLVAKELGQALQKAFALQDVLARHLASAHQSSVPSTEEEHDDAFDRENEARANDQNISSGVNNDQDDEEPGWVLSSGDLQKELKPVPQPEKDPRSQWDFRIGKNGVIEHFRTEDGHVAVRESAEKIHILAKDHDAMALALERALERFGAHLHFDGGQAGARTLIDIVVTHDLRVTFTDDRLNAQIELRRVQNGLDRGRPTSTAELEQSPAQKRGAGASASDSTPEKKIAGNAANQQDGEVFLDAGAAPFDFDKKNELNYFVRTITPQGEQRVYWGKDFPRALEEAGAKVGDSITPRRVASKPVTVEQVQEQPDGTKQVVRVDTKRNSWQVDNHGINRQAVIKAYDGLVKTREDRKRLERSAPLLVAARDQAVVELKREKLAAELAQRNSQNHAVRL